ncbi:MAG: hypothetical protein GXP54_07690 [Deltaproteobacteria bacterium]|nr:hypothetical protein [Deltaproteobacteria bacterium]
MRDEKIIKALHEYMLSPESPFTPTDDDWARIAEAFTLNQGHDALAKVIASTQSFKSSGMPPDVAATLARILIQRGRAVNIGLICQILNDRLFNDVDRAAVPAQALVRTAGVFAELLDPPPQAKKPPDFIVSGFPVIQPIVESELLGGLWTTAAIIIFVCFLFALIVARSPGLAFAALGEAVAATLLTFALGWALRIQVDSSSATLYLIPPMLMFSLSPSIHRAGDHEARRFPVAFALGLAAAPLSLLLTGVLPVVRLGLSMSLGLASVALIASLSRRVRI